MSHINAVLETLARYGSEQTDGRWLEDLTTRIAPYLQEWDIVGCWTWAEWPEREQHFPGTTRLDIGIDLVAKRRSDGGLIPIQCKARQLDESGRGAVIPKNEIAKFVSAAAGDLWGERWLVTNGGNALGREATRLIEVSGRPVKLVNLAADVRAQADADRAYNETCGHCDTGSGKRSRTCMQEEAVGTAVRLLRDHHDSDTGGLPRGQARGRIILPCGTGKTRIALRITERLTFPGQLSVVLCPSIALVAQIRREFLQHRQVGMRILAVCSDRTAGYAPAREDVAGRMLDPTRDASNVSASEVKGPVTTDPDVIADWIQAGRSHERDISVMIGTYQSGRMIADALADCGTEVQVLVCDEAHRTAGIRRPKPDTDEDGRLRDFTLCHDQGAFPAHHRVYQTATPRIYTPGWRKKAAKADFLVRSMDDESVFGVELYRRSYVEAVRNGWLSDYRIIALGVGDRDSYDVANRLARYTTSTVAKTKRPNTRNYLKGLALAMAMAGATRTDTAAAVNLESCIAFCNTVAKSKEMAKVLCSDTVRDWVARRLPDGQAAAPYTLEHLDATSPVSRRDEAKMRLSEADPQSPHGVINVGIFGEGTDSPSLSAVAFLEPRRSPIDVVQAVGRAMRVAEGKDVGYIVCPVVIPRGTADAEQWLSAADPDDGWRELADILLALRAHDSRIEEELADLLTVYISPQTRLALETATYVAVGNPRSKRLSYAVHRGEPGAVEDIVERVARDETRLLDADGMEPVQPDSWTTETEPQRVVTAVKHPDDGTVQVRYDNVVRDKPSAQGEPGRVNAKRTQACARDVANRRRGRAVPDRAERLRRREARETRRREREESAARQMLLRVEGEYGRDIAVHLLERSGLVGNRVGRDLNVLEESITEAALHLREEGLQPALDRHFRLDGLSAEARRRQADGCVTAALLIMNAAMLHQRITTGGWLRNVPPLSEIKSAPDVVRRIIRAWQKITRQDFRPVVEPAIEAIQAAEDTGLLGGLERALRHLAAEAERLAEAYADMGADHAGPLFNRVMGNQASDGAYFTRPPAATIAARLALDACTDSAAVDWADPNTWRDHRAVDLACGSGTLLAALLTEMKQRAREAGADERQVAALQRLAVEDTIKGLDISPVSLQLTATQLTASNRDVKYRRMGLYQMPYGPTRDDLVPVAAGTLELLADDKVVPRAQMDLLRRAADSHVVRIGPDSLGDPEVDRSAQAVMGARIIIMNPPFTNRMNMGVKFPKPVQLDLRRRVDSMEHTLVAADRELEAFVDKNALRPLFVALADRCLDHERGVLAMIAPTVAMTALSGVNERRVLADRFHVHTVLTCHQPGNIALSQHTSINESIIVLARHPNEPKPPTRIINLDRLPVDNTEVEALFDCLAATTGGGGHRGRLGRSVGMALGASRGRRLVGRYLAIPRAGGSCCPIHVRSRSPAHVRGWPVGPRDRPAVAGSLRPRNCRSDRCVPDPQIQRGRRAAHHRGNPRRALGTQEGPSPYADTGKGRPPTGNSRPRHQLRPTLRSRIRQCICRQRLGTGNGDRREVRQGRRRLSELHGGTVAAHEKPRQEADVPQLRGSNHQRPSCS